MKKMAFEATLEALERGYTWPSTQLYRTVVPADDLKKYNLQRKKGSDQVNYSIWVLATGEMGQALTYHYGHRPLDAAKKAYEEKFPNGQPET